MDQLGLSQSKCSKILPMPKEDISNLISGRWMGSDFPTDSEVQPMNDALISRTGSKWGDLCDQKSQLPISLWEPKNGSELKV